MNATNWQKIKDVFALVLEQPAERRGEFLREACGDDSELHAEVASLLEAHDDSGPVLERRDYGAASVFDAAGANYTGREFGHYRVIREIGRGGMGAVFLAERADGEFEQRVALKVVRRSFADSDLARRFRRERQILATLSHPNIARLLDGGVSADGEPYLVMEYVEGTRVDDYCETKNLSTAGRLRLFLGICQGVAYAHQHLVVHRDLKPSNILVTDEGVPKLLDFGIAKLLDPGQAGGEETRTGLRAFTPDYAAPEQIRGGQITTASDVYSLGVLLGDLLRGARPSSEAGRAPGGWRSEPRGEKTAAAGLPTDGGGKARTRSRRLAGGELENIVSMARHEDPARRYASAAQLAEDVQRYLDGRPVRAQKDSFTYRAGKFVRRNRAAVTAAALVAVALVAGLALALWQAGVARRERDRAERRFNDVRRLANALLTDIAPKIENLQGATGARESVVAQSLQYLNSLTEEAGGDPQLQSELAMAYEKVGDIQGNPMNPNLGDLAGGIASYEKAQRMRLRLLESDPNDFEQRRLLAANHQALGYLHWQANELEKSAAQAETALRLYETLAAERPDSPELRLALAQVTYDAGDARKDNSSFTDAITYFQKALDLLAPLLQSDPNNVRYLKLAGTCYSKLGNSLSWEGRQKEAEAETQKAVRIYESLAASHPNDVSVSYGLWMTYWMANSTYEGTDDALSHEYALKALRTIQAVVEKDPADSQARDDMGRTLSVLAQASVKIGEVAEGISYAERAVAELTRLLEADPRRGGTKGSISQALMRLAEARAKQKDFAGALAELERSERMVGELRRAEAKDISSHRNLAVIWEYRAKVHLDWAKTAAGEGRRAHEEAARNSYARAVETLEQLDAQKMLPEFDRQWLERLRADLSGHKR